jgi:photosystem II stability/assembly factor-like uncharacterized protein
VRRLALLAAVVALLAGCTSSTSGSGEASTPVTTPTGLRTLTGPPIPASATPPPSTAAPSTAAPSTSLAPVPRSGPLNGFLVADLTFVGTLGWALGTAGCTSGSGRCTAIAHSTDNGRTWHSIKAPAVNVAIPGLETGSCAAPCVSSIRYASPAVGYVFGPSALLMTTDGGHHWRHQSGGADALESLDGNVIRISDRGGCPPGCAYVVQVADVGGTTWRTVPHTGFATKTSGVALSRTGVHAYLEEFGSPAGGGNNARSTLWTSADDGRHWTNRGEPCPQGGNELDSTALTTAPDGSVTVLCRARVASGRQFVATSTDGGVHFRAGSRSALGGADVAALGAASASTLLVSSDDTYRSTDGGRHFARLSANSDSSPGALAWLGFASPTTGHGISVDRRSIWTTIDGGRSWVAGRLR